jgi:hypothetical protein
MTNLSLNLLTRPRDYIGPRAPDKEVATLEMQSNYELEVSKLIEGYLCLACNLGGCNCYRTTLISLKLEYGDSVVTQISKMDWDIIDARVEKACDRHQFKRKTVGFLAIVVDQIFPGHEGQLQEIVTDGPDDKGVDAIHIVEGESNAEVFIFQSKYRESQGTCHKTINDVEVLKISLFLSELFDKAKSLSESGNFQLQEAVRRIWELHDKGKICRYKIIFCSNGSGFSTSAQGIIESVKASHSSVSFEFYGGQDVVKAMAIEGRNSEDGQLQVIGKEILERSDGDVRGAIASVDALSFVELITAEDGETIKRHLFDDNLRVFLGAYSAYTGMNIGGQNRDQKSL